MDSPSGFWWSLMTIAGPIVLGLVLLWALLRNRSQRRDIGRTEQATREVYREEEAKRRDGSDGAA